MDTQSQTQEPCFLMRKQRDINSDRDNGVHWVKADAAAPGVINGISQQVINVNQDPQHHQCESYRQLLTVEASRNGKGNQNVQGKM